MEVRIETIEAMKQKQDNHEEDIKELKAENKELRNIVADLIRRVSLNENDIKSVLDRLFKIDSNTTWILRLIIGSLIVGILGFFFTYTHK
jgi:hypothetical protein